MKKSFYQLGQLWASNTQQTEVPTAQEVREYIQKAINLSAKRVSDANIEEFRLGATTVVVPETIEETPKTKRKYTKKTKVKEVPVVEEVAEEETPEEETEDNEEEEA